MRDHAERTWDEVQAYQEIHDGGRSFAIPQNQNDPQNVTRFFESLDVKPGPSDNLQMTYWHDVESVPASRFGLA